MQEPSPPAPATLLSGERASALLAWMPLIWLLAMTVVVAVLLRNVVNCDLAPVSSPMKGCVPHSPAVEPVWGKPFTELSGRLKWSITALLFALTIAMTYSIALWTIFNALRQAAHRAYALAAVGVSAAVAGLTYPYLPAGQIFEFNRPLLDPTVYRISRAHAFVSAVEILGTSALFILAFAVSLVLLQARRTGTGATGRLVAEDAALLQGDQERVRILLYAGALSLVAGTLQASALYSWAISMLAAEPIAVLGPLTAPYFADAGDIPRVMGMLNGSFYSILLASIFLPAFVFLRATALKLAHEADPRATPAQRQKWLEENAIGSTLPMQFRSAAALVAPMLAGGPLTALFDAFGR